MAVNLDGEGWIVGAATLGGQSNGFVKEGGGWDTYHCIPWTAEADARLIRPG